MLIEPICSTFAGVSKTKYVSGPSRLVFREGNYKKRPADVLNDSNRGSNSDEWNPRERVLANKEGT